MDGQSGIDHRPLHEHLAERRQQMRISKAEAARRAGVGRMTWWEWERGRRHPYDANYGGIEDAMEWEPGSVQTIMDGRGPVEKAPVDPPWLVDGAPDLRDEVERELWAITELSEATRWAYITRRRRRLRQRSAAEAPHRDVG